MVAEFVITRRVVDKLSLFMGSGNLIMVGRGWLWVMEVKNDWLVVGGRGCLWMSVAGRGWSWDAAGLPVFFKGNI